MGKFSSPVVTQPCTNEVEVLPSPESSLLSTVISFVYKDKWWFDESMSVIFCTENLKKNSLIPSSH